MEINEAWFRKVQMDQDNIRWHRFHYCQAWTGRYDGVHVIKSYSTVVAAVVHDNETGTYTLHKRGWYSTTTTRQINRIMKEMFL